MHGLSFAYSGQQTVLQELIVAESQCRERVLRLEKAIEDSMLDWPLTPVVERLQALRGVRLICAATFMVEVGDVRRFTNPRQLMAYLGGPLGWRLTSIWASWRVVAASMCRTTR